MAVLIAIDPFPWALNEAFDLYRILAESNGRAIGMMSGRPISVVLSGDSAYVLFVRFQDLSPTPHAYCFITNSLINLVVPILLPDSCARSSSSRIPLFNLAHHPHPHERDERSAPSLLYPIRAQ